MSESHAQARRRAETISSEDWTHTSYESGKPVHKMRDPGHGLDTGIRVLEDGRLNIDLTPAQPWLQRIVRHTKDHPYPRGPLSRQHSSLPPSAQHTNPYPIRLNIVIQVVGSRGDIQPFLAIGKRLRSHGHRVRLATHLSFREAVEKEDLEFFNIGGDPAELMAFMVRNPGLMPDMRTIRSGAIRLRRKEMKSIFSGCWRSCFEMGDGTGDEHQLPEDPWAEDYDKGNDDWKTMPFVADVIIANPPSFAHMSCAEKMGVPLSLMFTMPWSATQAFPHPLASIQSQSTGPSVANFASYAIVEIMMWEGLGDLINRFRKRELGLDPLDAIRAPSIAHRLQIPYTYLWSPALLDKPLDWGDNIDVVGFSTLPGAPDYKPPKDLQNFLNNGPPPIYIGFGSIVVDDPSELTKIVFDAVRETKVRAVISKGWGNIGAGQADTPEIMMIDKCPHDWLFRHVSAVVHHGGAGTTAAGLALGKPTIIVPFFGDQTFWGSIVSRAGAGPDPIPYKRLTTEKLAEGIRVAMKEETKKKTAEIGEIMRQEEGVRNAVCSFYRHLDYDSLRCSICPSRPAVWWVKHSGHIKLSAFAATVLVETGLVKPHNLVLYRSKEYDTSRDPKGPLTAGAEVLYGVVTDFVSAMAEIPTDMAEIFRGENRHRLRRSKKHLQHGKRAPSPVRQWKKEHFNQGNGVTDSSSERKSESVKGKTSAEVHFKDQDKDQGEGEGDGEGANGKRSTEVHFKDDDQGEPGKKSFSDSVVSSSTESSYASAREETESTSASGSTPASASNSPPSPTASETNVLHTIETGVPSDRAHIPAISKTPTNDDPTDDMESLSLEDTLRRQTSRDKSVETREVLTDARYHVTRAGKHILDWILLLPTDLSLSFSKGFHNAPKIYHDSMVQETPTVRGVRGGMRAAGTEFTQELYQGVTGIVTQPKHGRKESGTKGMIKGVGKGVGGVLLKPVAGLWGLAGYPLEGLHKTLRNSLSRSKIRDILSSRITQGLGEMVAATPEERAKVIEKWNEIQSAEGQKNGNAS